MAIHYILEASDLAATLVAQGKNPAQPRDRVYRLMDDGSIKEEIVKSDGTLRLVHHTSKAAFDLLGRLATDVAGNLRLDGVIVGEAPDLTPYALAADIPPPPDLTPYALAANIPPPVDITPLATKTELQAVQDAIPAPPDLTPYATTTALASYAPQANLDVTQADLDAAEASLNDALARIAALEAGGGPPPVTIDYTTTPPSIGTFTTATEGESVASILAQMNQGAPVASDGSAVTVTRSLYTSEGEQLANVQAGTVLTEARFTATTANAVAVVATVSLNVTVQAAVAGAIANQTATFGADTLSGSGGYITRGTTGASITGASITGGTATGVALSANGILTPTADGSMSAQNGATITITCDQGTATITLSVAPGRTVRTESEINAAIVAAKASGSSIVLLRNGDYDLGLVNGLSAYDFTARPLTIQAQDTPLAARFVDSRKDFSSTKNLTLRGLTFYWSRAYTIAQGGYSGPKLLLFSGANITLDNCLMAGEPVPLSVMQDNTATYPDGYPVPWPLDTTNMTGPWTITNCRVEYVQAINLSAVGGSLLENFELEEVYFDFIRLIGTNNTNGGEIIFRNLRMGGAFGKYNEQTGGSAPHPDSIQFFDKGGSAPAAPCDLVLDNVFVWAGQRRNNALQGIFLHNSPAGLRQILVRNCGLAIESSHGFSATAGTEYMVLQSGFYAWDGVDGVASKAGSPDTKNYTSWRNGFGGYIDPAQRYDYIESIDNFTESAVLTGPLNVNSYEELIAGITPIAGQAAANIGPVDTSGNLRPLPPVPRPAAAPGLSASGGTLTVARAVPTNLDGGTIASYQLRHRVSGSSGSTWQKVSGITAAQNVTLAGGTYEVQTRPIMTYGNPGFWSKSGIITLAGAPASLVNFTATPSTNATALSTITPITNGWRIVINAGAASSFIHWPTAGATASNGPFTFTFSYLTGDATRTASARVAANTGATTIRGLNATITAATGVNTANSHSVTASADAQFIGFYLANSGTTPLTIDITNISLVKT